MKHKTPAGSPAPEIKMQPPSFKAPAFAILAKKKYVWTADLMKVPGQHVKDAEVHGVKYIMDTLDQKMLRNPKLATTTPLLDR